TWAVAARTRWHRVSRSNRGSLPGLAATTTTRRSHDRAAASTTATWPRWTGSKVPAKSPTCTPTLSPKPTQAVGFGAHLGQGGGVDRVGIFWQSDCQKIDREERTVAAITPNEDQFVAYAKSEHEGEVHMLNLLRYKRSAETNKEDGDRTGEGEYAEYGRQVVKMVEDRGGRVVWMGKPIGVFIGDVDANERDAIALVAYPSRQAFLDMVSTKEYGEAHSHREAGLADTVLIACAPAPDFLTIEAAG